MIYAIDFDDTIYRDDQLNESMVNRIQELRDAGNKVFVYTSRLGKALAYAKDVLSGIELDGIVGGKFYADFYIDDRNMTIDDFLRKEEERQMTPNEKIKFKNQAQERTVLLTPVTDGQKRFDTEKYVEGYAAKYDKYLLWDDGDWGKVYERFDPKCFEKTDMSDVIMQFDHAGRVFARITNNTLAVEADETGLFMAADLDKTEQARGIYEDIVAGMLTKMSWRFKVGKYYVEREEGSKDRTIVHTEIPKIYDVSVVSIPANNNTEINARDFVHGVMDEIARSEAELDERRRRLLLKIKTT